MCVAVLRLVGDILVSWALWAALSECLQGDMLLRVSFLKLTQF